MTGRPNFQPIFEPEGPWRSEAACRGMEPAIFIPPQGKGKFAAPQAKAVCATCPSITPCGDYATAQPELVGVWGGMTEHERQQHRRKGRMLVCAECGDSFSGGASRSYYCGERCRSVARNRVKENHRLGVSAG